MDKIFLVLCTFAVIFGRARATCTGCVSLDTLTFDKVIENFKFSIVKFDVPYPYGPKHEAFEEFAKNVAEQHDLVVGSVGVKDYGEKDNQEIADRFGVDAKEFPAVLLFRKDNLKEPVVFKDDFTVDNLRRFVRQNSDLYLGLAGCIKEFDELAVKFVRSSADDRQSVLADTEERAAALEGNKVDIAKVYVAFMKRVAERGTTFVEAEKQRLKKILNGKVSDAKKDDLKRRLNVLESFTIPGKSIKSEL